MNIPSITSQESKTEKVIKMRDATLEERKSVDKYIKSISKPTGVDFWDLIQEPQKKRCMDCNHYGKLSLDCGRCDDDCSMFEPKESEEV